MAGSCCSSFRCWYLLAGLLKHFRRQPKTTAKCLTRAAPDCTRRQPYGLAARHSLQGIQVQGDQMLRVLLCYVQHHWPGSCYAASLHFSLCRCLACALTCRSTSAASNCPACLAGMDRACRPDSTALLGRHPHQRLNAASSIHNLHTDHGDTDHEDNTATFTL